MAIYWCLLFVICIHCVDVIFADILSHYVSPDPVANETCSVNSNTILRPCYSLHRLSIDKTLLSLVTLILLPGTHVIPENYTLTTSDVSKLEIFPWNNAQQVTIRCQSQAGIAFQNIRELKLVSLVVASCTLSLGRQFNNRNFDVVGITNCRFTGSLKDYAIVIYKERPLNISVHNCTFSSNNAGAIKVSEEYYEEYYYNKIILVITDTMFSWNWSPTLGGALHIYVDLADLKLLRCQFVNNSATSGGAIYFYGFFSSSFYYTNLMIDTTTFQNNLAHKSGGAIFFPCPLILLFSRTTLLSLQVVQFIHICTVH